jgi:eukaryotic-like serine/threonine-protein kinase
VASEDSFDSDQTAFRPASDPPAERKSRFAAGDLVADRYRIVAQLGRGGMGAVYRAHDTRLDHEVALKFLPEEATNDPRMTERLLSEVRIGRQIAHPNVCRLYDVGDDRGLMFIAMEFVDGEDLASLLRRIGRLPASKAVMLARDLAAGLSAAHDLGVIHRDLKPANVMVDGRGTAKIADFGLAIVRADARVGEWAGTPAYMAPEQLEGQPASVRSDVYALGLVLYEMFTGVRLFEADSVTEIRRLHEQPKPSISSIAGDIDPVMEAMILACLAESPDKRPPTAHALLERLPRTSPSLTSSRPSSRHTPSSQPADKRSVAVLPFEDLSPDKADEYFSDGLAEEIISDLTKVRALRVISRGSSMRFKGSQDIQSVARELQVSFVLTGSVRKAGTNLRVTANLVDGTTDSLVWSEKFRGTVEDVFEIQETVARAVAEQLKVKLTEEESAKLTERPIPNVIAYEAYLRARASILKFTEEGITTGMELLRQGMAVGGENVLMLSAMAYAWWQYYNSGIVVDEANLQKAEQIAARIHEIEPGSSHAQRILGLVAFSRGKVREGFERLNRVLAADPNDPDALVWLALMHIFAGHLDIGRTLGERLRKIDPFSAFANWPPLFIAWAEGRYRDAAAHANRVSASEPDNASFAWAQVYSLTMAEDPVALELLEELQTRFPNLFHSNLAAFHTLAGFGRPEEARRYLTPELEESTRHDLQYATIVADGLAQCGDVDKALEYLGIAIDRGSVAVDQLEKHDRMLAPLKSDPRFAELMRKARAFSDELRLLAG